jgi:hypothetical protein
MKNKELIQHALIYLFIPEDSSEFINMGRPGGTPQLWSSCPTWLGAIKTIFWTLLAIVLPIVLITLSS